MVEICGHELEDDKNVIKVFGGTGHENVLNLDDIFMTAQQSEKLEFTEDAHGDGDLVKAATDSLDGDEFAGFIIDSGTDDTTGALANDLLDGVLVLQQGHFEELLA